MNFAKRFVFSVGVLFLISSCIPASRMNEYRRDGYKLGYLEFQDECFRSQSDLSASHERLEEEIRVKNKRLAQFNQLNSDGSLRTASKDTHLQKSANKKAHKITGNESWMK